MSRCVCGKRRGYFRPDQERISAPLSLTASSSPRGSPGLGFDRGVFGPVSPGPPSVFLSFSTIPTLSNPTSPRKSSARVRQLEACVSEENKTKDECVLQRLVRVSLVHHVRPAGLFRGFDADTYSTVRDSGILGGLFLQKRPWIRLRPHALFPLIRSFSSLLIYSGTLPSHILVGAGKRPRGKSAWQD